MNRNLVGYRTLIGLTQTEMCKKIGMSLSSYSERENGKREFRASEMKKIMEIINEKYPLMTMEEIFFLIEK